MGGSVARSRDPSVPLESHPSPASGRLDAQTLPVAALSQATRDRMWEIFRDAYADVTRATFERDLAPKSHVILLCDSGDGSLQGFSTLQAQRHLLQGRRLWSVFSGDTIVAPDYWGQTALQRAFLGYVIRQKLRHPFTPVYWFLITKGYKTYLLLSRNFPEYWPRWDRPTPAWAAAIIDTLARERFAAAWRPELGVLQHAHGEGRLREHVAPVEGALLAQPDVRFFCARNPGHVRGDELCTIGRVDGWLWLSYMGKLARRGLARALGRRSAARLKVWTASS